MAVVAMPVPMTARMARAIKEDDRQLWFFTLDEMVRLAGLHRNERLLIGSKHHEKVAGMSWIYVFREKETPTGLEIFASAVLPDEMIPGFIGVSSELQRYVRQPMSRYCVDHNSTFDDWCDLSSL